MYIKNLTPTGKLYNVYQKIIILSYYIIFNVLSVIEKISP